MNGEYFISLLAQIEFLRENDCRAKAFYVRLFRDFNFSYVHVNLHMYISQAFSGLSNSHQKLRHGLYRCCNDTAKDFYY